MFVRTCGWPVQACIMTHCHRDEVHCHDHRSVGTYERDIS